MPSQIVGKEWPSQQTVPGAKPPRGIFAAQPSSTPKYTKGLPRQDFTETMARMYVKMPNADARNRLIANVEKDDLTTPTLVRPLTMNGYMDFLINRVNHQYSEKMEVIETLTDHSIVYFFGQSTPIFNYSGLLVNSKEDDQAVNFFRLYRDVIRGSQLARRKKRVSIRYDSYIASGAITNLSDDFMSENEMLVNFNFSLIVTDLILFPNPEFGLVSLEEEFDKDRLMQDETDVNATFRSPRASMVPPEKVTAPPESATEEPKPIEVRYELREPGTLAPPVGGASFDPATLGQRR